MDRLATIVAVCLALSATGLRAQTVLPGPAGNRTTADKILLGKILFWDVQLSSDDRVACGSCHQPRFGGAAPAVGRHPGADGRLGSKDDVFGAPGIRRQAEQGKPIGKPQLSRRAAPSNFGALTAQRQFWDGRAKGRFTDPLSGLLLLRSGGALENQALQPILDHSEMAHAGRTWPDVLRKLGRVRPLDKAGNLPQRLRRALKEHPTYPALTAAAFGDPAITPSRIAFALAAYQRTLVADQTPYDRFLAGDTAALTVNQKAGLKQMQRIGCLQCHTPPAFTDHSFRNIGTWPDAGDPGLAEVSGRAKDRGSFKVPSLRNVGLRKRLMHHGRFADLDAAIRHYALLGIYGGNERNLDPLLRDAMYANSKRRGQIADFLRHGLTDPRVQRATPPFDHPTLK